MCTNIHMHPNTNTKNSKNQMKNKNCVPEEGLGPTPNDGTEFDASPWKDSPFLWQRRGIG